MRLCQLLLAAFLVSSLPAVVFAQSAAPQAAVEAAPLVEWIFFKDKGISSPAQLDAALARVAATADPYMVARRKARRTLPGLFDERDVPVVSAYVDAVKATGAHVRNTSKWVNAVSVSASADQLAAIRQLPFVKATQPVGRSRRIDPRLQVTPVASLGDLENPAGFYGLAEEQLTQINLIQLHEAGYTGQGVRIGILDTGFLRTHDAFNNPAHPLQVIAEWDFVFGDGNTANEPEDTSTRTARSSSVRSARICRASTSAARTTPLSFSARPKISAAKRLSKKTTMSPAWSSSKPTAATWRLPRSFTSTGTTSPTSTA